MSNIKLPSIVSAVAFIRIKLPALLKGIIQDEESSLSNKSNIFSFGRFSNMLIASLVELYFSAGNLKLVKRQPNANRNIFHANCNSLLHFFFIVLYNLKRNWQWFIDI